MEEINLCFTRLQEICNSLELTISHMFHRTLDSRWSFDNHCHNYTRLYFILDGGGILYNDTERVLLSANNIYIVPAKSTYNYRCPEYMEQIFVHFMLTIIPQMDLFSNVKHIVKIPSNAEELSGIKDMFYKESAYGAMFIESYIRSLALEILKPYADSIERDMEIFKRYEGIYKYINDNTYADITVENICRSIGFSQTYIGQKFKHDTGSTIKEYIDFVLICKMKEMLQAGSTLHDIADSLHFSGDSYCSRFFKKHMGISPRVYAKKFAHPFKQHSDL